jgi:hypothetical protein
MGEGRRHGGVGHLDGGPGLWGEGRPGGEGRGGEPAGRRPFGSRHPSRFPGPSDP